MDLCGFLRHHEESKTERRSFQAYGESRRAAVEHVVTNHYRNNLIKSKGNVHPQKTAVCSRCSIYLYLSYRLKGKQNE